MGRHSRSACTALRWLRRCGRQFPCIRMLWITHERIGFTCLDNLTSLHDNDVIEQQADDVQVVADEQIAHAQPGPQIDQQVQDHGLYRHVESGGWFIQYQQCRFQCNRSGDTDTCLLSARQLMRKTIKQVQWQADQVRQFIDAGRQGLFRQPTQTFQGLQQGMTCAMARVQAVCCILEDHLDIAAKWVSG